MGGFAMKDRSAAVRTTVSILIGAILLAVLYLTSLHSYLLFHSLIELFTVTVAAGIFVIAWNTRDYLDNNYLLFIGIVSVFVALLDLMHTLAYQDMGVFADRGANLATQLWVAARYLQSLSLLIAPFFLGRKLRVHLLMAVCTLLTGLVLGAIFYWHIFPVAYVDGVGLTAFKKVSEYVISFFLLTSIGLLIWKRGEFDARVLRDLTLSLTLTVGSELAFTSYVSVYGPANLVGHILRLVAFYFLYRAIIETGLVHPFSILLRKLKLSENRLRKDAAVLQARNEELDAYAHTVAHDLKNPLTVIIAATDVIKVAPHLSADELKDFLREIKSTAFEMDGIIDNLLLFSEVRSEETPLGPVDMARAVKRVRERLGHMIKERRARVVCSRSWPAAVGYSPWIEEVWANYLSNAIKYGGESPRVRLGATVEGDMIRFWIRDCGPGIPPEEQKRLFVPFSQLRKTHKTGHGLGLSIVLHIVKKLGGEVGVESEPGKGSLFYFMLPAAPPQKAAATDRPLRSRRKTPETVS